MSKLTPEIFFDTYGDAAVNACSGTPYLPSVLLAQAAMESGWDGTSLSANHNNFFGIKDSASWNGPTVVLNTPKDPTDTSTFRTYDDAEQSFKDRNHVLDANPQWYSAVGMATDAEGQAMALQNSPYSGDPLYGVHLMEIVNKHDLTQYDSKKK